MDRRNLAALALIAAAVRLVLVLAYSPVLATDSHSYLDLAHRLASLHLHGATGTRTPGYPLLLLVLGYSPTAVWCVQALLGVAATMLVYGLVRRLGGGPRMALVAGLLYVLDLEVLALEHIVLTETLTSFLLLAAAHVTVSLVQAQRVGRGALIGLGLALAYLCLVRPDAVAVTVYLSIALGVAARLRDNAPARARWGRAARHALWIVAPTVAVLAVWAGVNRATIGVTSVSTVLGHNMIDHVAAYVQVQPGSDQAITSAYVAARRRREERTSDLANLSGDAEPAMERASHLDFPRLSGRLLSIALVTIERHPLAYLASSVKQWPRFWLAPNYADQFATGSARPAIQTIWKLERGLIALINIAFVLLLVADLLRRLLRRPALHRRAALIIAWIPVVGLLTATFLAYGETGRYGYVYFPMILSVTLATAELLWQPGRARVAWVRGRLRSTRV